MQGVGKAKACPSFLFAVLTFAEALVLFFTLASRVSKNPLREIDHPVVGVGTSTGFSAGIGRARSRFAGIAR